MDFDWPAPRLSSPIPLILVTAMALANPGCAGWWTDALDAQIINYSARERHAHVTVTFGPEGADRQTVFEYASVVPANTTVRLGEVGGGEGTYRFAVVVDNETTASEDFAFDHWRGLFQIDIRVRDDGTDAANVTISGRFT